MTDIAPDLLEEIEKVFTIKRERDKILGPIYWKIQEGKGTYRDVAEYADRLGEILAEAMKLRISTDNLPDGRMYYNIAERVIGPLLKEDHELIADAAVAAQESLNRAAGLHLKAVRPKLNEDRLEGLIDKISTAENFDDVSWLLDEPVINFSRAVVDDTIRENVDFHARAGLQPKIKRIAESGCCEWCSQLAGEYNYPVDREVYQRHERCRCLVLYDPGDGKVQDAHTKVVYYSQAKAERDARVARARELEKQAERKNDIVHQLVRSPEMVTRYTPEELAKAMRDDGYNVLPLNNGSHRGIQLDQGGGFKVNFEDGGLIMYHPEERSHHSGEYYKISTGKGGTKRYGRDGKEKK